jgi:hypothetical protein
VIALSWSRIQLFFRSSGLYGQMASLKCIRLQHREQNSLSVTTVELWPFSSFLDVEAFVLLDVLHCQ